MFVLFFRVQEKESTGLWIVQLFPSQVNPSTDRSVQKEAMHIDRYHLLSSAPSYVQFQHAFHDTVEMEFDIVIDVGTLQFITGIGLQYDL